MIATTIIQLITGAIGSVGFGILFHIKKKYLPLAAVGGFLSWLVFLLGKEFWGNVFLPTLLAGFVTDVDVQARYDSFCFWNCSRNEYCVVDLLFSENCKEKVELTWQERNSR